MEIIVARTFLTLLLAVALMGSAFSAQACRLSLKPETSGFVLSPTLQKLVVEKAVPSPDKPCGLVAGDELLQVNDRVIPGAKAKEVMAYWKGLPKGSTTTFKVLRDGVTLTVASK